MYEGNPGEIDFGSSYRESTVIEDFALVLKIKDTAESFILLFSPER